MSSPVAKQLPPVMAPLPSMVPSSSMTSVPSAASKGSVVSVAPGAIQLNLTIDGSILGNDPQFVNEVSNIVNEAFSQFVTQIRGK